MDDGQHMHDGQHMDDGQHMVVSIIMDLSWFMNEHD